MPIPWRIVAPILAMIAAFTAGWAVNGWRWQAKAAKVEIAAQKAADKAQGVVDAIGREYEAERDAATSQARNRTDELRTIYRDRVVPADCAAPDAARSVLAQAVEAANGRAGREPGGDVPGPASAP